MPALLGVVAALTFPQAVGARHSSSGATWTAQVNGVVLYCADHPRPRWWSAPTRPRCWPAEATDSFWFDWAAFHPDTAVWTG
jgi:hypothetical protein